MICWEERNTVTEMKNTMDRINSKLDTAITGISELDSSKEMSWIAAQRHPEMANKRGRLRALEDRREDLNGLTEVPEEKRENKWVQTVHEKYWLRTFQSR